MFTVKKEVISDYTTFLNPVNILKIKTKLNFIKNPHSSKWGGVLANGVLRIQKHDYELIVKTGLSDTV